MGRGRARPGAQPQGDPWGRARCSGEAPKGFRAAYTPGHASHHVAYLHEAGGTAYCGDVAGVRIGDGPIIPPTPPPDIDLDLWRASVGVLEDWAPERLALTHWGSFSDVAGHLAALRRELDACEEQAARLDAEGYGAWVAARYEGAEARESYVQASPPETLWPGLDRWLASRER